MVSFTALKGFITFLYQYAVSHFQVNRPLSVKAKVKVKFSLEQATKAQRGSKGRAVLFLQPWR